MIASRLGSTSLPMDVILENCVPGESGTALVTGGNQGSNPCSLSFTSGYCSAIEKCKIAGVALSDLQVLSNCMWRFNFFSCGPREIQGAPK